MVIKELYPFVQAYAFIIGLAVGSFLNVIIYRIPNNKSIVKPRSKCTGCETQISWYDNIPVLSYVLLLGKCRNCKASISVRYPLIEFICGLMTVMLLKYLWYIVRIFCYRIILLHANCNHIH